MQCGITPLLLQIFDADNFVGRFLMLIMAVD